MMISRVLRTARRRVLTPVQALSHGPVALSPQDVRSSAQPGAGANSAVLALSALAAAGSVAAFSSSSADSSSSCEAADANAPVYLSSAEEFLYPAIQPYNTGMLQVSDKHTLYYEECGNPQGKVHIAA